MQHGGSVQARSFPTYPNVAPRKRGPSGKGKRKRQTILRYCDVINASRMIHPSEAHVANDIIRAVHQAMDNAKDAFKAKRKKAACVSCGCLYTVVKFRNGLAGVDSASLVHHLLNNCRQFAFVERYDKMLQRMRDIKAGKTQPALAPKVRNRSMPRPSSAIAPAWQLPRPRAARPVPLPLGGSGAAAAPLSRTKKLGPTQGDTGTKSEDTDTNNDDRDMKGGRGAVDASKDFSHQRTENNSNPIIVCACVSLDIAMNEVTPYIVDCIRINLEATNLSVIEVGSPKPGVTTFDLELTYPVHLHTSVSPTCAFVHKHKDDGLMMTF